MGEILNPLMSLIFIEYPIMGGEFLADRRNGNLKWYRVRVNLNSNRSYFCFVDHREDYNSNCICSSVIGLILASFDIVFSEK